jgi:carboxylesterase family protein
MRSLTATAITILFVTAALHAQVTPQIATQLRELGPSVCVPETAKIYKPLLLDKPPYKEVTVLRDVSYLPDPRTVMDVFAPEKGGGNRPVLIYIPGGNGDKLHPPPDGDAFYDNVMVWAVKNGMVGVNMQRRGGLNGGGLAWDQGAKDVGVVVDWVRQNITKYKGNPNRIFLWAHSAGNGPASTYVGHPEIMGANADAIKGVILMSSPNFNIAPETVGAPGGAAARGRGNTPAGPVGVCGRPPAEPRGGGADGGRGGAAANAGRGGQAQPDQATLLARSNLPGLVKGKTAVFLGWGEIDPQNILTFDEALKTALCNAGRCPTSVFFKDHSHMSLVFSPNTPDKSVTEPILKWMKSVK